MKIIIELDGPQARRAWRALSESFTIEGGEMDAEAGPAPMRPESMLGFSAAATDAGPAPPALFRAFGRTSDAEAVEQALADLSPARRPPAEIRYN
jgi:hypothetical protein